MHWIFAGQQGYAAQNPMELENDVIEAPSQLLEEWVWDYDTLKRFATNAAGEPIPAALVEKMNSSRRFAEEFGTMTQLRSEEHTSELQSLMRIPYAVFCLNKQTANSTH